MGSAARDAERVVRSVYTSHGFCNLENYRLRLLLHRRVDRHTHQPTRIKGRLTPAAISVVVGAVTVRVHTIEALHSYVGAWRRAERLGAVLDPPAMVLDPGRD